LQHLEVGPFLGGKLGAARLLEGVNRVAALLDLQAQHIQHRRIVEAANGRNARFFSGGFILGGLAVGRDRGIADCR
jgi:hypothetical protein